MITFPKKYLLPQRFFRKSLESYQKSEYPLCKIITSQKNACTKRICQLKNCYILIKVIMHASMIKNTIDKCLNKVSKNSLKWLKMLQKLWHNMSYKKVSPPWIHSSFESARDPRDLGVTLRAFCHPYDICNNFYQWHLVIRLQKLELVFGHTTDERTDGQTDLYVEIVI